MFVKVWTAIRRGQSAAVDLAMLAMFDAVSRLRLKPAAGLPHYLAAGLPQAGPFIVSRHVDGLPLSALAIIDSVDETAIIDQTAQAIDTLHALGRLTGALTPANITIPRPPCASLVPPT